MKILVYGAGVLGSFLAYEMSRTGHEVTILARGTRCDEIRDNGLVIRHYAQMRTTITPVNVTDSFNEDDYYDAVFVVMQRTQIENVIPKLSSNRKCKLYILVGNNPTVNKTCQNILENSTVNPTILFAFQVSGGRREGGKVISIHLGRVSFHIGTPDGDTSYKPNIANIFASSCFNVKHSSNMDSWLKCHAAFILPLAYLTYWANGDLKKASKNKEMLNLTIDAIAEGYEVIRTCGYPIEPEEDEDYIRNNRKKLYWMLKIMAATPIGRLAVSDHAMSAIGEMRFLSNEFDSLKKSVSLSTPNWDRLEQYLAKE